MGCGSSLEIARKQTAPEPELEAPPLAPPSPAANTLNAGMTPAPGKGKTPGAPTGVQNNLNAGMTPAHRNHKGAPEQWGAD